MNQPWLQNFDPLGNPWLSTLAAAVPDARLIVLPGVGHMVHDAAPELVVHEIDAMIGTAYIQPIAENLGDSSKDIDEIYTLYRAGAKVDFSTAKKARLVGLYNDQLVRERMIKGGGVLGCALLALAAIAGYIRADEATKGYYTNRLRMLAAAGVGGAGVLIYQLLA